jgi:hypothetical protein
VPPHTLTIQVKVLMHRSSAQAILWYSYITYPTVVVKLLYINCCNT